MTDRIYVVLSPSTGKSARSILPEASPHKEGTRRFGARSVDAAAKREGASHPRSDVA
jgi:hypothetical protein